MGLSLSAFCFGSSSTSVFDLNQLNLLMRLLGTDLVKDNPAYFVDFVDMRITLTVFTATDWSDSEIGHQRVTYHV